MDFAKAEQKGRDTVLSGTRFFDLQQTLDNGQAFRWARVSGADENKTAAQKFSHFTGIAHGRRLELVFCKNALTIKNCSLEEFEAVWKKYFDFTRCYEEIHSRLSEFSQEKNARENEILRRAINFAPGLRLLRQDVWEVLISFILSQNSNIPRIKKMVESLCENFGEKSACGGFAFPSAEKLAALNAADLAPIKCGYRAAYVVDAARRVANGEFDIRASEKLSSDKIFRELLKIRGVGEKVADCVLLYGFGRTERFPKDVWIKRAMTEFFPDGFPREIENIAGIAQQFLFFYVRS